MKQKSQYPIDIVIPWVDGGDMDWYNEKIKYSLDQNQQNSTHVFDYKDWGLLKYWFRGIEKNAPWIRKIFFITWGHLPKWLDTNNKKLVIVKHEDYIPQEYLPTFSSHVIELNIHRIKGLSDHFIYFNDDVYLIDKTAPAFYFKKGYPCDSAIINPIAPKGRNVISNLQLTTVAIINEHFSKHKVIKKNPLKWFNPKYAQLLPLNFIFLPWGRFPGLLEKHVASSFLKSTFKEVWEEEFEQLDETCRHKFRNFKTDVNQWIMKEWQIASGRFMPRSVNKSKSLPIRDMDDARAASKVIRKKKYAMVCINDHLEGDDSEKIMRVIIDAFESILPEKSSFEK